MQDPFQFLKSNHRLPSPPGVAVRILRLVESDDSTIDEIAGVISSDPVLTAKILKYVNSPLVGLGFGGTTINEAVARIGMRGAQMLALSFSLVSEKNRESCPSFDLDQFWSESLARAVAARCLARHVGQCDPEDAFITALLCRLGKLLYATGLAKEYETVLRGAGSDDQPLEARERQVFGVDHLELSALLLQEWRLPEFICEAVKTFGRIPAEETTSALIRCLPVAEAVAVMLAGPDCQDPRSLAGVMATGERYLQIDASAMQNLLKQIGADWKNYGNVLSVQTGKVPDIEAIKQEADEHLEALRIATQVEVNNLRTENHQLNQLAQRDRLTALYNRRAFDDAITEAIAQAEANARPLALFMLDVDHFKRINDTHGHLVGDNVLKHVARIVNDAVNSEQTVFRYGGEEFAVLAPDCALEPAKTIAETLRAAIAKNPFQDERTEIELTASIGVAVAHWPDEPQSSESLISCADRRLYDAKAGGRNTWRAESRDTSPATSRPSRGLFSRLGRVFAPAGK